MSVPSFVVIMGMGVLLVEMQPSFARQGAPLVMQTGLPDQAGRNRRTAPIVVMTKNTSTMPCTTANTGPDGGLPGATAVSAGIFRNDWITSTKQLRYSETSPVTT